MIRLLAQEHGYIQDAEDKIARLANILQEHDKSILVKTISDKNSKLDAILAINEHKVLIECKSKVIPTDVLPIEAQLNSYQKDNDAYIMILADYITPAAMVNLKEKGINYMDKVGNMSLKLPELFMYIQGIKTESTLTRYKSRAFTKKGAAVVFQLLMDPALVNAPQRKMAAYAGVSLGTIPKVLEGLKQDGFLVRLDKRSYKLVNYEKLLHKWVDVLKDKILPANYIGLYSLGNQAPKSLLQKGLITAETQWGGEPAAALLQQFLIPEEYSLFTTEKENLISKYKLLPTSNGDIKIYKKFWHHTTYHKETVHPILIYGQLIASEQSRKIEIAEMIKNEYIRAEASC